MDATQFQVFMKHQQEMLMTQQEFIKNFMDQSMSTSSSTILKPSMEKLMDTISNSISTFTYDADSGLTFESWYNRHEDAFTIDGKELDDASKTRLLLRKIDSVSHERYTNYVLPKNPREIKFDETVETLKKIFGRKISDFATRYQCLKFEKKINQDFLTYAGLVNKYCEDFKLASTTVDQFKCLIFVCGLTQPTDADIRTRLLAKIESEPKTTVADLVSECDRILALKQDTAMVGNSNSQLFDTKKVEYNKNKPKTNCWFCGGLHYGRDCWYKQHKCNECQEIGHKEGFCKNKSNNNNHSNKNNVNNRNNNNSSRKSKGKRRFKNNNRQSNFSNHGTNSSTSKGIFLVSKIDYDSHRKYINVMIDGVSIKLQMDTASDVTIISQETVQKLLNPKTSPTKNSAKNASGGELKLTSQLSCRIAFNGIESDAICYISNVPGLNILGIDWIEILQLWDIPISSVCNQLSVSSTPVIQFVDMVKDRFKILFDGSLGACTQAEAVLYLKENIQPVYKPKRPVPFAAYPAIDAELNRLENIGVIEKVNYSQWAAPIVAVTKANGTTRICGDFSTGLNDALESHRYPLPLPEDIFATMAGGKFFSKIDLSDAYLQIKVQNESKQFLTINTHRGLFQYNRLPFGVKSAPGIFQQIMDSMMADIEGAVSYLDDIIVVGKTAEDHKVKLIKTLERIYNWGFRLRYEKCSLFMTEISYLGFIIDQNGRHSNPNRTKAIRDMPQPRDVTMVRSFLGMINQYSPFINNIRQIRAPLDKLLSKEVKFKWSKECQQSFEMAKQALQSELLLTHFDPTKEIVVAGDASNYGIGGVIMHKYFDGTQRPVAHASRALTTTEQKYSQAEKEALSLIFCVKKFHRMIHGRKFTLCTDHQPLLSIFGSKKGIPVYTANRLQRWALILLAYDFKIVYKNTNNFGYADALSRLIEQNRPTEKEDFVIASIKFEADINQVLINSIKHFPITSELVSKETSKDLLLQQVIKFMQSTWPVKIENKFLKNFHNRKDSLSLIKNCIMLGNRIVIPVALQKGVLNQLHIGHPGIVRMKSIARSFVYWPNIDDDVVQLVQQCSHCASVSKAPTKTNLMTWPIVEKPWSRIHVDYAGPFEDKMFLLIVDSYSKWPEIFIMSTTTSNATIIKLNEVFARFGIPDVLVSDNGTQFTSNEFKEFCEMSGVQHIRTSPFHPQSNGQVERFVDTFKRAMKKMKAESMLQKSLQIFLQCYRSTPNPALEDGMSPAETMFGRKIKTIHHLLIPKDSNDQPKRNEVMENQFNTKHGTVQREFKPNDKIYVANYSHGKRTWIPGIILNKIGSVMYSVKVDGHVFRRHTNQIIRRHGENNANNLDFFDIFQEQYHIASNKQSNDADDGPTEEQKDVPEEINESQDQDNVHRPKRSRRPPERLISEVGPDGRYMTRR